MKTITQKEAERRIRAALQHIESAQWKVSDAMGAISRISGPTVPKEYDRLSKLFDSIRSHWYSLDQKLAGAQFDLDSEEGPKFLASPAAAQDGIA